MGGKAYCVPGTVLVGIEAMTKTWISPSRDFQTLGRRKVQERTNYRKS